MNSLTNLFKILSDETRLRILLLLYQEELCVCQLSGILEVAQPKISKSLSKLRDLNLVEDKRQEKFVYYSLKQENKALLKILGEIHEEREGYPLLTKDKQGLAEKDSYLSQCGVGGNEEKDGE